MLFINTRPKGRAEQLHQALVYQSHQVIDLPLLELLPQPYSDELAQLYAELTQVQVIVVVSPIAAEIGLDYLRKSGLTHQALRLIQWVAVGEKTAASLRDFGIHAEVPQVETSEGMLQLCCFKQSNALKKVAFWRGEGGRQFMMQELIKKQITILNFILYSRHLPENTVQSWASITAHINQSIVPVCVLISSEASWNFWLKLVDMLPVVHHKCHYVVLGVRLFNLVSHNKYTNIKSHLVHCIDSLKPEAILGALRRIEGNT